MAPSAASTSALVLATPNEKRTVPLGKISRVLWAEDANFSAADEDVEAVYEKIGKEEYTLLMKAQ